MGLGAQPQTRPSEAVLFPSGHVFAVLRSPALFDSLRWELVAQGTAAEDVLHFTGEDGARMLKTGWCALRRSSTPFRVYGGAAVQYANSYAGAARGGRHVVGIPAPDPVTQHQVRDLVHRHSGELVGYFSPGGYVEPLDL